MSNENNEEETVAPTTHAADVAKSLESATAAGAGIASGLMANPKVLYVAGGAAVIIALVLMMSGGSSEQTKAIAAVAPGQTVTVSNPNGGDTQLNALPTLVSVAQTEEDEKQIVCRVTPGTQATVLEERASGAISFVRLQVKDGTCQGNAGWTAKINVK